jgi:hypothetical protein
VGRGFNHDINHREADRRLAAEVPILRPSPGTAPIHTRRFAFRAPQAHHESVKMPNPTRSQSSARCASDDASSIVMMRPVPLLYVGPASAGISPGSLRALSFQNQQFLFNTNEPLFRTRNFVTHTKKTTSPLLFDADERLSRTSNVATHTKQNTSLQSAPFFLFDTNERSQIATHQSLITNHQSLRQAKTP